MNIVSTKSQAAQVNDEGFTLVTKKNEIKKKYKSGNMMEPYSTRARDLVVKDFSENHSFQADVELNKTFVDENLMKI